MTIFNIWLDANRSFTGKTYVQKKINTSLPTFLLMGYESTVVSFYLSWMMCLIVHQHLPIHSYPLTKLSFKCINSKFHILIMI